jgi:Family of unknown function (DUF5955)
VRGRMRGEKDVLSKDAGGVEPLYGAVAATDGAAIVASEPTSGAKAVDADPRLTGLRLSVDRMRRELAGHPAVLADRDIAEEELAALDAMAADGVPELLRMRRSLLLIAGALGSVSALQPALRELRTAIDRCGEVTRQPGGG